MTYEEILKQASERPWKSDGGDDPNICDPGSRIVAVRHWIPKNEWQANTELICRAVNSYQTMVEACEFVLENDLLDECAADANQSRGGDLLRAALKLAKEGK